MHQGPTLPAAPIPDEPPANADRGLFRRHYRAAVLELEQNRLVRAAGGAAVRRIDLGGDLVARLEALAGHAVAYQQSWRAALEHPFGAGAVLALDLEDEQGVRTDEPEFLHHARDFDRVLGVEHGERVMRQRGARADGESERGERSDRLQFHDVFPLTLATHGSVSLDGRLVLCTVIAGVVFL